MAMRVTKKPVCPLCKEPCDYVLDEIDFAEKHYVHLFVMDRITYPKKCIVPNKGTACGVDTTGDTAGGGGPPGDPVEIGTYID